MSLCYTFVLLLGTFVVDKHTSSSWQQSSFVNVFVYVFILYYGT